MEGKSLCRVLLFLLIVATFSSFPAISADGSTDYCGAQEDYSVKVDSVDIEPNPVVRGEAATFNISASSGDGISGGKLTIEVYFYGLRVHTESHNLCTKTTCPIKEGSFILTHSQSLPAFTPPGTYRLRIKMTDTDNELLTCIYVKFNIVRGSIISKIKDPAASGVVQRT